jgi:cytochrome c oxidase subunit 3
LGIGFCITQILGWSELTQGGIYFAGKTSNPSGSFLYILSGVHLAHIFSALIYCAVILKKSFQNKYNSKNLAGVRHCGIFWHFLDGLWVYLFIFLLCMQ